MSLAIVYSRASMGVQAPLVTIEVHLSNGKPGFTLVGLPEKTVKEAQDRVRSALMNAQFKYPAKRITVNLAPADLPKEGGRFDLPIAIGILAASDQLDGSRLKQFEFVGELALTGELRGVHGVIPAILAAQKAKRAPIIAYQNANEASLVSEQETYFAKNLLAAKRELTYCSVCGRLTDDDPCNICTDQTRDRTKILVVEDSKDVSAMEKIQEYRGLYHVLQGLISPMNGVGPDDINLKSLITRLMDSEVEEVIIATNATADGEATAMYISRVLKPAGIKVTRLARGLAVGSDIEYADEVTLLRAIENRTEL